MSKYITVVKRTPDEESFLQEVVKLLTDNFNLEGIHSLGEVSEVDNMERFIAFISGEEFGSHNCELMVSRLMAEGFGAKAHDSLEEALTYAKETYEFEDENARLQAKYDEMKKKFPPLKAKEVEQVTIFDLFYMTRKVTPMRGKLDDEECVVIATVSQGEDDIKVLPLAILLNDSLKESLEVALPVGED